MELLAAKDLSLQNEGYFAFKHVTFSLYQNEIAYILGDNGSGKTQFLDTLASLKSPDSGKLEIAPKARFGYLPQINPEVITKTVKKYLSDVRSLSGNLAVRDSQLKELITYMGMSPYLDRPVRQLSLGLKQRVGFLAAVVGHPNILLLDEPFSFQNSEMITNMLDIIKDLRDNHSGIVIASTVQDDSVVNYFDTNYLMKDNSLIKVTDQNQAVHYMLIFTVKSNTMALPSDISHYLSTNVDNLIELKVPMKIKDSIIKEMLELNYNFEGARVLEN
ncbi:gliding motility protein GldA [Companilactobacillus tucceti DSM 20183]|uniref:Gliding motility protein GldA n=1 Tax=Companilactobacillus tucceti DSM 20183 TaxID=1423811 RepID=A0A0R1JC87_9LACO|nr:ATP-binding cassette domain-containing protein [Companilactobacillus tucceti]KRK64839.1 gliding motility protein GldA [Companilactobacillus tucceti DSM 20183]